VLLVYQTLPMILVAGMSVASRMTTSTSTMELTGLSDSVIYRVVLLGYCVMLYRSVVVRTLRAVCQFLLIHYRYFLIRSC